MAWRVDLHLFISEIDRQHREVVDLAARLHATIRTAQSAGELQSVLAEFTATVENHFASEEALMLSRGYDQYATHRMEHQRLLDQVYIVQRDLACGTIQPCESLARFVQLWTEKHILTSDRRLAAFLSSFN